MNNKIKKVSLIFLIMAVLMGACFLMRGGFNRIVNTIISKVNLETVDEVEASKIKFNYNGKEVQNIVYQSYEKNGQVMTPIHEIENIFYSAAWVTSENTIAILFNNVEYTANSLSHTISSDNINVSDFYMEKKNGRYYVSINSVVKAFGGTFKYDESNMQVTINIDSINEDTVLCPAKYDSRDYSRLGNVRDQGYSPTCWSAATASTIEASIRPLDMASVSTDNIINLNTYGYDREKGGNAYIARSYLAAWKGPVDQDLDSEDGESEENLPLMKHVQETVEIEDGDISSIKECVYKYGAVQSSMYLDMTALNTPTDYYNYDTCAYYYNGNKEVNHAVTIIGWDDTYSADNFKIRPAADGAFICQNSWGSVFGENGVFYVSYESAQFAVSMMAYSEIEDTDNYDNIYQTDMLGYVGTIGYSVDEAWMANVYYHDSGETLEAVGFYATDKNTSYRVYVVENYEGKSSFNNKVKVAQGKLDNPGFYTIPFDSVSLGKEGNYAVVVWIKTKKSENPIAIEYQSDSLETTIDLSDGKGFISPTGSEWTSAEAEDKCNICLKAYTKNGN